MPWRSIGTALQGSCHTYPEAGISAYSMPGLTVPDAHLRPSYYAKFGIEQASTELSLPAVAASGVDIITAIPRCRIHKIVWCQPTTTANTFQALQCQVKKQAQLVDVSTITISKKAWYISRCTSDDGAHRSGLYSRSSAPAFCDGIVAQKFASWVNLSNIHTTCDATIKLL